MHPGSIVGLETVGGGFFILYQVLRNEGFKKRTASKADQIGSKRIHERIEVQVHNKPKRFVFDQQGRAGKNLQDLCLFIEMKMERLRIQQGAAFRKLRSP